MKWYEVIAGIFDAVFPLWMLFCGVVLGLTLADWLESREKKNKKPDDDKTEGDGK